MEQQLIKKEIARNTILLEGQTHSVSYNTIDPDCPVRVAVGRSVPKPIFMNSKETNGLNEFQIFRLAIDKFNDKGFWPTKSEHYESIGLGWFFDEFEDHDSKSDDDLGFDHD
ncbi:hypothetical protein [Moritella sp. F3]|uniref:hypothetical protein n=1 Tax=Moritella sp. F3 TaxID=2718882 RepID=UPI0018E0EB75|nr:hypothetical protein [Moritella sp. F3]